MRTTNIIIGSIAVVALAVAGGAYYVLTLPEAAPATPQAAEAKTPPPAASSKASEQPSAEQAAASSEPEAPQGKIVKGTAGNDNIAGTAANERIYAAEDTDPQGQDTIDGREGDDRIYADAGDVVTGGPGHDELIVRGTAGFKLKLAGSGIEETWGGDGDDDFDGVDATDALILRGGEGKDRLRGGVANDVLYGGLGDDKLDGGPGDDNLKGEGGTDTLTGGSGADYFNYPEYDGSTDIITDYSSADGDTVTAASFSVRGADTVLLDANGNELFVLKNYDAGKSGVSRRK